MAELQAVDRLEVRIVVDNVTDGLSSTPSFVDSEWNLLWKGGLPVMSGKCLCGAAHGLSCYVTAERAGMRRTLLFDTGPEDAVFERNLWRLGLDPGAIETIVLSHGHWDHAGGMLRALDMIRQRNGGRPVPYYAHPDMFRSRATKRPDGGLAPMEDVPDPRALAQHGAEVVVTTEAQFILGGLALVSGEIPRVTPFEPGIPAQVRRTLDGTGWEPDTVVKDERYVAVNVAGKGLVVFTACSHAGVVNVLTDARTRFPGTRLHCVLGGLHLSGANEKVIPETVAALKGFDLGVIAAGHCTGWRALGALAAEFGDGVVAPLAVGKRFTFAAAGAA